MRVDLKSPTKLGDLFDDYVRTAFKDVPIGDTQLNEMRKAFFAGCYGVLQITAKIGDDEVSEDFGCYVLESMHQEVKRYAASLADNGKGGPTDEEVATSTSKE